MIKIGQILSEVREAPPRLLIWTGGLWCGAVALAVVLAGLGNELTNIWILLGLSAAAGLAERQSVWVTRNIETSISFLPLVLTAVAFGPLSAMLVALLANVPILGRPYLKWAVYHPRAA